MNQNKSSTENVQKTKKGRPLKDIDEDLVYKLASIGCTFNEIADFFNVNRKTIINRFGDTVRDGHTQMKQSLRRAQLKAAMDGNVTMLIWLGKQLLGQRDQPTENNKPIEKITLKKVSNE